MSGSGGFRGYEPPARIQFDCQSGTIKTNLSSVVLSILAIHNVGDVLNVEIGPTGALILITNNRQIIGSIMHANTRDIIECINAGNSYIGEIISIITPVCTVIIRRV